MSNLSCYNLKLQYSALVFSPRESTTMTGFTLCLSPKIASISLKYGWRLHISFTSAFYLIIVFSIRRLQI
jgi:hypothetical protein